MTPILFDSAETTYTTNGIGRMDAISCTVTEELNGMFELEMTYPASGPRFSDLVVSNIILAQPYDGAAPQPFRIYRVGKEMAGRVTVSARHLSYQLNWIPVMPFNYSSLADCLSKLKSQSVYTNPFTFWTDKTVATGGAFVEPLPVRACLGGVQGSVLQRYGGDYEWDNWTVKLLTHRGADNGVRISYGKNLVDAQQETNIENTYTGVCPYYINTDTNEVTTLPEKYIAASTASGFPFLRIQAVDFSSEFDNPPTAAELRTRTQQYIEANNIGHPHVSVDVNFVALWQTEEYKDVTPLERVQLGDTVTVHFEKLDIDEQARVVAYTYDVLRERYEQITIGDLRSSFAKTFVDQGHLIEETQDSIKEEITKGTSWLTKGNGYVVAIKNTDGSWKELVFLDTPSIQTAQKVLRINENGIGFSSTGINGNYAQSWTLDGTLTLGGINNSYGSLELKDITAKTTAVFDNQGIWLDYYKNNVLKGTAAIDGWGISTFEENSNAMAGVAPGSVDVVDSDGTGSTLTGSTLDVGGISIADETLTAPTVQASTLEVGDIEANGETGQNQAFSVGGYDLTFNSGILTDVSGGSGSGYTGNVMLEGDIYVFENGILVDIE